MTSDNGLYGTLSKPWASVQKMRSFHKQQQNKNKLSQAAKAHEYPELFQQHDMLCIWHETTPFSVILIALACFFYRGGY